MVRASQKTKIKKSPKKAVKKKRSKDQSLNNQTVHEIIGLSLFIAGAYIWISIQYPYTTGIIGKWILSQPMLTFFGNSIKALPYILIASASAIMVAKSRISLILVTSLSVFLGINVLFALNPYKFDTVYMGGILGRNLFSLLSSLIGTLGIKLALIGLFISAPLILFNISIKVVLGFINEKFTSIDEEAVLAQKYQSTPKGPSLLKKVLLALFYKKEFIRLPQPTIKKKRSTKKTKEEFLNDYSPNQFGMDNFDLDDKKPSEKTANEEPQLEEKK